MAQRQELKTLYLCTEGIDDKGNALAVNNQLKQEDAKKRLIEMLVSTLSKCYAQIEVAKKLRWLNDEEAELIVESAKDRNGKQVGRKDRKPYYIAEIESSIDKALEAADKERVFTKGASNNGLL